MDDFTFGVEVVQTLQDLRINKDVIREQLFPRAKRAIRLMGVEERRCGRFWVFAVSLICFCPEAVGDRSGRRSRLIASHFSAWRSGGGRPAAAETEQRLHALVRWLRGEMAESAASSDGAEV